MRVIVGHHDPTQSDLTRQASLKCWGGPDLVRVIPAGDDVAILKWLTARTAWPDVIFTSVPFLEKYPQLTLVLKRHPGRGYWRWLVLAEGSDEILRARLGAFGDEIIAEPVTPERLAAALQSWPTVSAHA